MREVCTDPQKLLLCLLYMSIIDPIEIDILHPYHRGKLGLFSQYMHAGLA